MADKNGLTPQAAEELLKYKKLLDGGLISLEDYEAKKAQILEPNKRAEDDEKKEKTFLTACKQIKSDKVEVVQKGIEALQSINDWKDAKQKIAEAQAKLQELSEYSEDTLLQAQNNLLKKEQKKIQKKEKRKANWKRHKKLWISLISVACALVIGVFIFIPCWYTQVPITYELNEDGGYTITNKYVDFFGNDFTNKNLKSYKIPSTHLGKPVTKIERAFMGWNKLESVEIPDSVTSIDSHAFYNCNSLTSITIPDSVTSIGEYAFNGCHSLANVTIGNSVTSIGEYAFNGCHSLANVTIGNSVTSIGEYAFFDCYSLANVTIGNSVTSIGNYAFAWCESLTSILIPNSVTSIGYNAFNGCTSLTIYCEAEEKPEGWGKNWNCNCPVVWGYKG